MRNLIRAPLIGAEIKNVLTDKLRLLKLQKKEIKKGALENSNAPLFIMYILLTILLRYLQVCVHQPKYGHNVHKQ